MSAAQMGRDSEPSRTESPEDKKQCADFNDGAAFLQVLQRIAAALENQNELLGIQNSALESIAGGVN